MGNVHAPSKVGNNKLGKKKVKKNPYQVFIQYSEWFKNTKDPDVIYLAKLFADADVTGDGILDITTTMHTLDLMNCTPPQDEIHKLFAQLDQVPLAFLLRSRDGCYSDQSSTDFRGLFRRRLFWSPGIDDDACYLCVGGVECRVVAKGASEGCTAPEHVAFGSDRYFVECSQFLP